MKRSPTSRFTKKGQGARTRDPGRDPWYAGSGTTALCPDRSPPRETNAFTLIELLVAMLVLALMAIVLAQMLSATSQIWLAGQAKANNFTKGRAMLDLLARDLQTGIY